MLSGDIEAFAESRLLADQRNAIDTDILVAPHHGSNTSSTSAFIAVTSSAYVLFPVGYRNRFGFHDRCVIERYQPQGTRIWQTDRAGTISVTLIPGLAPLVNGYREQVGRFWARHPLYH